MNIGDGVTNDSKVKVIDVEREGGGGRGYDRVKKMS